MQLAKKRGAPRSREQGAYATPCAQATPVRLTSAAHALSHFLVLVRN